PETNIKPPLPLQQTWRLLLLFSDFLIMLTFIHSKQTFLDEGGEANPQRRWQKLSLPMKAKKSRQPCSRTQQSSSVTITAYGATRVLASQCLPEGPRSTYIMVTVEGVLAGNAFACRWEYEGRQVCWITQLVVHSDYRERRLASSLLSTLIDNDDDILGIMSSHPAACKALVKAVGELRFAEIPLDFAATHAVGVMSASPVSYIKDAKVCGRLFDAQDTSGMICGVDSNFYVDHAEPQEALLEFQADGNWPLGDLSDGHEFLLLVNKPRRRRSRSASSQRSGTGSAGKQELQGPS
ncbi:hypothetical protein FJTKL_11196, partial [Diaporthe vaccinii]